MFRLGHISDPHFRAFPGLSPLAFFGKRLVGGANLILNRRRKHRMELLESLGRDLKERPLDHLAVTGDLGNIGLAAEWRAAYRWLERYAPKHRDVTVIPGNHDIYTPDVVKHGGFEAVMGPYQKADYRCGSEVYPFVRFRGDGVALVAVNTCVPTGDLGAWGQIGSEQMGRLETLLTEPELERRTRVVLLHHPPFIHRRAEAHNLRDREQLCALLAKTGADLVLHGHDHRDEEVWLDGPRGRKIPVVGAGSASYAGHASGRARYNIYEIAPERPIVKTTYVHDANTDRFVEAFRAPLSPA